MTTGKANRTVPEQLAHELTRTQALRQQGRHDEAIAALQRLRAQYPDDGTVLQYWSQGAPPAQVQPAMETWQAVPGVHHILMDRHAAYRFLHRDWRQDWLRACNRAGSPTGESDFLRLCHLGLHGGSCADCDDWSAGDPGELLCSGKRLTRYREPTGALGNNVIIAPRRPGIRSSCGRRSGRGAHCWKGRGDNVWNCTGPGLLTRAVVWYLENMRKTGKDPALRILPRWRLGLVVQYHSPPAHEFGAGYWNCPNQTGSLSALERYLHETCCG